ncbi:MAG: hypothetical protein CSB24_02215 [Deltaproteobacteria bacterium]|nr:MAG: hypothetical protein CSB24_02215 [Deltaproteobacteria bacterium]
MARGKAAGSRSVKKIRFELTRSSIGGIAVICFCLFLWMFLIGVWIGQSVLSPRPEIGGVVGNSSKKMPPPFIRASEKKRVLMKKGGGK